MVTETTSLTADQIETFLLDGVLVVDGLLSNDEIKSFRSGLACTLFRHGINDQDLLQTGHNLRNLSSTNGSGGVLDIFYEDWKLEIATNTNLLSWTQQLWTAGYCNSIEDQDVDNDWKWHPYGSFDTSKAYVYIDRIGYRLPSSLSEELGQEQIHGSKKQKKQALQRGLTPHLDCCPDTYDNPNGKAKWRPIQCFVSLTDTLEPNMGGFEAAKGFHRGFRTWTKERPHTTFRKRDSTVSFPAPCVGEYTHMRPKEDAMVMEQMQHVSVRAGSVVFWDNRIPHANAYNHNGSFPRAVVYCSFLPDVAINRMYVKEQLEKWKQGKSPTDQWVDPTHKEEDEDHALTLLNTMLPRLSKLQRQLFGMDSWQET